MCYLILLSYKALLYQSYVFLWKPLKLAGYT